MTPFGAKILTAAVLLLMMPLFIRAANAFPKLIRGEGLFFLFLLFVAPAFALLGIWFLQYLFKAVYYEFA
jgi:hypothetical protein